MKVHDLPPLILGPDRFGLTIVCAGDRLTAHNGVAPSVGAGAQVVPCDGLELRPGWVCAHTHLYSGLAPLGMPAPTPAPASFIEILERVWWRLDRALDHDALRAAARLYVDEALLAGTTTLVDHHESPRCIEGSLDVLADACAGLGVQAVLCYVPRRKSRTDPRHN